MAVSKELWTAYFRIFIVELAYWIISIGMVFVNEFVLSANVLTDDLTVFITIFQISFSLSILVTLSRLTENYLNPTSTDASHTLEVDSLGLIASDEKLVVPNDSSWQDDLQNNRRRTGANRNHNIDPDSLLNLFEVKIPHHIKLETCKLVFPLSILYVGMLLMNNFCLKYVGVAFYFVSRSLTTVFNVTFTYFLINEPVSRGAVISCAFIVLGFLLGIDQENVIGSLSVIGVIFGVASSLFTSLFSIYTKKTLAELDRNIWVLVLYNNVNAIAICTPLLIVHGDVQALISDKVISPSFWVLLSISGVMAFFISIVTNASIKYTSPLTHNISGTAKACLQTVIAVIYYNDHKSILWWISNITILVASAAYSRIKQQEMSARLSCSTRQFGRKNQSISGQSSVLNLVTHPDNGHSDSSDDSAVCLDSQIKDSCSIKL